jgi:hypothetical protein
MQVEYRQDSEDRLFAGRRAEVHHRTLRDHLG